MLIFKRNEEIYCRLAERWASKELHSLLDVDVAAWVLYHIW